MKGNNPKLGGTLENQILFALLFGRQSPFFFERCTIYVIKFEFALYHQHARSVHCGFFFFFCSSNIQSGVFFSD
jgi:hypothetical protein